MFKSLGQMIPLISAFAAKVLETILVRWSYNRIEHAIELLDKSTYAYYRLKRRGYKDKLNDITYEARKLLGDIEEQEGYDSRDKDLTVTINLKEKDNG